MCFGYVTTLTYHFQEFWRQTDGLRSLCVLKEPPCELGALCPQKNTGLWKRCWECYWRCTYLEENKTEGDEAAPIFARMHIYWYELLI